MAYNKQGCELTPEALLTDFVEQRLGGDIDNLKDFELGKLYKDNVYGCPNRNFDSDDTNLMRAIYCLVFKDAWHELSMQTLESGRFRGDTINTYSSLFGRPWNKPDKFVEKWKPDEEFVAKRNSFNITCYTIGNMMVLPNKSVNGWTLNTHRGCHDQWHDYADRFLVELHKNLTYQQDADLDLQELIDANGKEFQCFYGQDGWKNFIDKNLLSYYVNEGYVPKLTSKGYVYWRGGYTNRDRFLEEANRYIDFASSIIHNRANRMIEILKIKI